MKTRIESNRTESNWFKKQSNRIESNSLSEKLTRIESNRIESNHDFSGSFRSLISIPSLPVAQVLFKELPTYRIKDAGLLAMVKENIFCVSPLRHVEHILLEEEGYHSENPCLYIVCVCYSENLHSCKQY
jgi:hypothetical protein